MSQMSSLEYHFQGIQSQNYTTIHGERHRVADGPYKGVLYSQKVTRFYGTQPSLRRIWETLKSFFIVCKLTSKEFHTSEEKCLTY